MKWIIPGTLLIALAACSQEPAPAPDVAASQPSADLAATPQTVAGPSETPEQEAEPVSATALGPAGLGDIVVGKAPPASAKIDKTQISDACQTYSDKPRRLYIMTDGKVVARITAMSGSEVKTAKGIGVGASEAAVRKAYPDAVATPHKYVEAPAKYLDWRPGGGNTGLRFEIDAQGKVSAIHAGREPEIEYVEGCG